MYLEVRGLTILYDRAMVVKNMNLHVDKGEMVSLVGPNGAGKTTLLRAVAGLVKWEKDVLKGTVGGKITIEGSVKFDGEELIDLPAYDIVKRGLILCPERGRLFREMTVRENLEIGAYLCDDKNAINERMERVHELFPVLQEREKQVSGTISGGERTMLSIGRALMSQTKCLLIDEPSVGLAPIVKEDLFECIKNIHEIDITVLITEQDVGFAFDLASRSYVISQGQMMAEGTPDELFADEIVRKSYLGL